MLIEVVEHLLRLSFASQLDYNAHTLPVGLIPHLRDAIELLVSDQLSYPLHQRSFIDLIGQLGNHDLVSSPSDRLLDMRSGSNHHPAMARCIGAPYPLQSL